jgi:uncharacterized protein YijF (DUF1287 family)
MLILATYFKVSYHGNKTTLTFKSEDQIDINEVIAEARKLKGIMYDPLQGKYNNIGGKLGFIVCIDIPLLAYQNADYSIKKVMEEDFKTHPEHYDTKDWNIPQNPFFHRRARNLYDYCKGTNRLIPLDQRPKNGDVVFYTKKQDGIISHIALITKAENNGSYWVIESAPETILSKETTNKKVEARGWIPISFGRIIKSEELK